jgi:hypothetical protein
MTDKQNKLIKQLRKAYEELQQEYDTVVEENIAMRTENNEQLSTAIEYDIIKQLQHAMHLDLHTNYLEVVKSKHHHKNIQDMIPCESINEYIEKYMKLNYKIEV